MKVRLQEDVTFECTCTKCNKTFNSLSLQTTLNNKVILSPLVRFCIHCKGKVSYKIIRDLRDGTQTYLQIGEPILLNWN